MSWAADNSTAALDWTQAGLDGLSLLGVASVAGGVAADLLNAGISAARGDWEGAGLSAAAAVAKKIAEQLGEATLFKIP